jgi:hypothetical protein
MNCLEIDDEVRRIMGEHNTDLDAKIDLGDDMLSEDLDYILARCDYDMDGSLTACDLHACLITEENFWRENNCGKY